MIAKKRISINELLESGLVPWNSAKTIRRKIKTEGFPCYKDGRYFFDPKEVEVWFKQRKYIAS